MDYDLFSIIYLFVIFSYLTKCISNESEFGMFVVSKFHFQYKFWLFISSYSPLKSWFIRFTPHESQIRNLLIEKMIDKLSIVRNVILCQTTFWKNDYFCWFDLDDIKRKQIFAPIHCYLKVELYLGLIL